ncbi:MAG TPA: nickel pincer cofactor biosynthesis protein LarC [Negativicutes bacterium]
MKAVYLDCFSGISGNMMLGALLDAGMPLAYLQAELQKMPVGGYRLLSERTIKKGISSYHVDVKITKWFERSRNLYDILDIINESQLTEYVKEGAKRIFTRLAEAEAKVHGVSIEKVHFHEVGAVDSIVDIVGTMIGLDFLGIEKVYVSDLHVGKGFVKCSHGRMPVPAPATAELLKNVPFYTTDVIGELVTPTGAAIATTLAETFGSMPAEFRTENIAYGAGTMDLDIANVLRMYVGKTIGNIDFKHSLKIIETNIDDMNPQIYGYVMEKLLEKGAMDVYLTAVMMKKGRPGTQITAIVTNESLQEVASTMLAETSTLGLRIRDCSCIHLEREMTEVETRWGKIRVKIGKQGDEIVNVAPEYDDCRQIAQLHNIPLKSVFNEAMGEAAKEKHSTKNIGNQAES